MVELLLERGNIDPNHPDKYDLTPLRWAALYGHGRVVKLLLEREDVDPDRQNKNGLTALVCAASEGHQGVVMGTIMIDQIMGVMIEHDRTIE